MPMQYVLEPGCTVVYVPMLEMIQKMYKHTDILDRIKETKSSEKGHYMSHQDIQENNLLSSSKLSLPLILYIDDLEIANPLGTSRKIHKLCSVYWVVADLPVKYRSALHVIQLAALCKVPDLKGSGYQGVLGPLLRDLRILEEDGVFIECLGQSVCGTVLCVVSDNLAAHSLAGFMQSFKAGYTVFVDSARLHKTKFSLSKSEMVNLVQGLKPVMTVMCRMLHKRVVKASLASKGTVP